MATPEEAVEEFLGIPALESEKGDWSVIIDKSHWHLIRRLIRFGTQQGIQRSQASDQIGIHPQAL